MDNCLKYIAALAVVLLSLFTVFFLMVQRSCRPTWFEPANAHIMPIGLDTVTGNIDTAGKYPASARLGFALHIVPEYVAEAAIEPGILGLSDTLTRFSAEIPDGQGGWKDATEQFFYGLPEECGALSGTTFYLGNLAVRWHSSWADSLRTWATIPGFVRRFNGKWLSGLEVQGAVFTFWLKPESDLAAKNSLTFRVRLETQKGKKWTRRLYINRVLSSSECREYLRKVAAGDSITLLYDSCATNFSHFIFIDHNRKARFYNLLLRFRIDEYDREQYEDFLKAQPGTLIEIPADLPREWIKVYPYQNRHYAYYPSDFGSHYQIQLNEKAFIGFQMDGLELYRIKAISRVDDQTWEIRTVSGESIRLSRLTPRSQIWRWKFSDREYLMTPAGHLRNLPVIVNYCEEQKQVEFDFRE